MTRTVKPLEGLKLLTLGLMLTVLTAGGLAWGQTVTPPAPKGQKAAPQRADQEVPLHITAAQLEADQDKHLIIFTGQVKAVHGDATLYADQLFVYFQPKEKGQAPPPAAPKGPEASPLGDLGGGKVDRIEARGNVRFVQEDRVATGQEGIYYRDKDEIVLRGNPQVWRGENHLKGHKIIFNLAAKKVTVESSPQQRVEAHLYQAAKGGKTPQDLFPGAKPATPKRSKGRKAPPS